MRPISNAAGKKFGRLLLLEHFTRSGKSFYRCRCDCGNEVEVRYHALFRPKSTTKSCGCYKSELIKKTKTKALAEVITTQLWGQYKRGAKLRGISWSLTRPELRDLVFTRCYFCGSLGDPKRTQWSRFLPAEQERSLLANGIDRLDSSQGYTIGNCVPKPYPGFAIAAHG